ncbi:FAD-dependent oxidoreductase [Nonomuraea sp. NPDC003754]
MATGLADVLPAVPGLAERWGRDVVHCPYCHGWESRDRPLVVLGTSLLSAHTAQLWRRLTDDVTFVLDPGVRLGPEQDEQLAARGIGVVRGPVTALRTEEDRLTGVRLADGRLIPCQALAVTTTLAARADFLAGLGLEPVDWMMGGHVVGARIEADESGATAVPGVYVAGNVTDLLGQVAGAVAAGVTTAAALNAAPIAKEIEHAVVEHRWAGETSSARIEAEVPFSARIAAEEGARVTSDRRHGR